jgi:hypothetical protein
MQPEPGGYSFSGHETFPFRYSWLKKGFDAVRRDRKTFQDENAVTLLGVGKNMVRSIRHWCLTTGLVEESREDGEKRAGGLTPSEFGTWLFDERDGLDPFLEDPATLWLLHWRIASNIERATTWHWTFSHWNDPEFTVDHLSSELHKWAQTLPGKDVAFESIRRDVECFVHTYVPTRGSRGSILEDTLDCPLIDLGLLRPGSDARTFQFRRGPQESLPDGILLFAIVEFWEGFAPKGDTLSVSDLSRQPGSPGRLFKIDESSLIERLERCEDLTDGALRYNETAGLRQLYRRSDRKHGLFQLKPYSLLELAYPAALAARGGTFR